jgi:hypothetical protein
LACGDLTDLEWRIIEGLLPSVGGNLAPLTTTGDISTGCYMFFGSATPGATCMSATASGIPSMCASIVERNKACGMDFSKRLSNWG